MKTLTQLCGNSYREPAPSMLGSRLLASRFPEHYVYGITPYLQDNTGKDAVKRKKKKEKNRSIGTLMTLQKKTCKVNYLPGQIITLEINYFSYCLCRNSKYNRAQKSWDKKKVCNVLQWANYILI